MVGLEKYIDSAIQTFTNTLWVGFNNAFLGRSYRLIKDGDTRPYTYLGNGDYKDVLLTDKKDSIVHFDVEPTRSVSASSMGVADVNVLFAVNLKKMYGNDIRAVEQAIYDINKSLLNTSFQIEQIVDGLEAYSIYGLKLKETHTFNMQPYYVVRFETTINYSFSKKC